MTKIRSILVATDLTEASDEVVRAAAPLAAARHADQHVLHAFDFPSVSITGRDVPAASFQGRVEAAERKLDEQLGRTLPEGAKAASRRVEIYVAHRAIVDVAEGVGADLIVLGPHSKRAGDGILGSTADRVIRSARVPCLIVRGPLSLPVRRIVVPLDLSDPGLGALEVGLSWGVTLGGHDDAATGTEVVVLHVVPRAFDMPDFPFDRAVIGPELHREVEAARQRVQGATDLEVTEEVRWGETPADEIVKMAAEEGVGLLVLGTHGHGVVKRALIGSVASGVARRAPCPVLLVPPGMLGPGGGDTSDDDEEAGARGS
jgi:nucleotide-binding universal stress UspA family protein